MSEHETETLLRDSLERLADRAPDGREVRGALARARRRRRPRLALAAVAAAVVVVSAGIPVALNVVSGTSADLTPAASRPVLGYTPDWLPDGFTEQYRSGGPGTAVQVRRWMAGPARVELAAHSTAEPEWAQTALRIAALRDQVVVDGRVGMVTGENAAAATVTWMPDDRHVLTAEVDGMPDARGVAEQVADSVRAEPAQVRGEARLGSLPNGLRELATTVQGSSPEDGSTTLDASAPAAPRAVAVRVTVGAGSPGLGGSAPVRVRGLPGAYVAASGPAEASVTVRLPSGRWLTASGRVPQAQLIAVADGVELDSAPDYGWLGD
ncbi:hypothetical protein [Amycolatopsis jiangsuensis]|uniref:Uncharacterized protein n=1 Tax=Amycolatopsis jiangsuensis TaxID=1181879 RepID=A0A840IUA0_9PSEU|nr:hypothetical protein [Amycolatopsis jiangsuensis]MBB4685099.1 hypothetical protein [Amycolatopsis jiangsuensis]